MWPSCIIHTLTLDGLMGQKNSQDHVNVIYGWSLIGVYPVLRSAYLKYFSSWQIAAPLLYAYNSVKKYYPTHCLKGLKINARIKT